MRDFLKNNPTLAFGLGLPLLLVIVFTVAAGLPSLTAEPPKYDVVFTTNYYPDSAAKERVQLNVVDGKVTANFVTGCNNCQTPELYRYNVASGKLKPIPLNPSKEAQEADNANYAAFVKASPGQVIPKRIIPIVIPELEHVKLNESNPAPDGYEFIHSEENYGSGGIIQELFFSQPYNHNEFMLRKGHNTISIPLVRHYNNDSGTRFLGWVVAP